jgi:pilus assembly protein CpaB
MRIIILAAAVGSAAMAAMLANGMIGKKPEKQVVEVNKVETIPVLVAAKDIGLGDKLVAGTVIWKDWPKANVTGSMITQDAMPDAISAMEKNRARSAFASGETIMEQKLLKAGDAGFMSAIVRKGMRAISVGISVTSSAGGFILPNDKVDVLLTRQLDGQSPSGGKNVVSETVLTNVRVLAINQTYKQDPTGEKVALEDGKTATLELTPQQAEVISTIESVGELSLALRSIADSEGKTPDTDLPALSDRFSGGKNNKKGTDLMIMRYGVPSYTAYR